MLLNGVLAGSEIALVSLRKTRLEELLAEDRGGARAAKRLRNHPENLLATVQIGITVIGATAGAFGGASIAAELVPHVRALPYVGPYVGSRADEVSLALVVGLISFLSLVLGELVPKSLALRSAEAYALFISRPLLVLSFLTTPIVWFLTASSNVVLRLFGDSTNFAEARLSPGEIQQLVDEATEAGAVEPIAGEIASRAIDFADLTAVRVMVPRHRVIGIPRGAEPDRIRRIVLEHGHTRMPVYAASLDDVVGYVTIRDLVTLFVESHLLVLDDILRPAFKVPESMRAVDLLTEMRRRKVQLAIVVDENGATSGIVTIEDLVEELVGEIASEHDEDEPAAITREPGGSAVVRGETPLHDVNRELELELPDGETWTTIAGLALELAGRIPRAGERFSSPDGTVLEIVAATPRQVKRVRVHPAPPEADDA